MTAVAATTPTAGTAAASSTRAATAAAAQCADVCAYASRRRRIKLDASDAPAVVQKLDHISAAPQLRINHFSFQARTGNHFVERYYGAAAARIEGAILIGAVAKAVFGYR
jgi:hypothetical protein